MTARNSPFYEKLLAERRPQPPYIDRATPPAARRVARVAAKSAVREAIPTAHLEECGFCHGKPVGNAARWIDTDAPEFAPCPRCGR